jgi:hypothetical protein
VPFVQTGAKRSGRTNLWLAWVTTLLLSSSGCVSYSSFKEARALDAHQVRVDVAAGFTHTLPQDGATAYLGGASSVRNSTEEPRDVVNPEVQVRYGLVDGFDLGVKTGLSNVELNSTIQLVRGTTFDLALAPAAQLAIGTNMDDEGWMAELLKLPLLADLRFCHGECAFVLGPAVAFETGNGLNKNQHGLDALLLGTSLGLSFPIAPYLRLMPEVSVYTAVFGKGIALSPDVVRVSPDVGPWKPTFIQAGMALSFGK